eukprot:CAMPEP_0201928100 /NCGR_PEP_ID=MMETSP0903-20130614/20170_1 /ASSEMBLY_ACC=CAM_ASM_000552 /TAXON_ID=420261 /ORGANISM="Thalassiosira antarctica, Strain CCMP982" /LENGTH=98 /DNA_ID=CAMNT_0048466475 /DNA_START=4 /DNA_END=298 /DNA_ORIENTATION=+
MRDRPRHTDTPLKKLALTDGELAALPNPETPSQKRAVKHRLLSTIWEAIVYEDHDGYKIYDESFGEAMAEGLGQGASCLGGLAFFSRGDEYQAEEAAW